MSKIVAKGNLYDKALNRFLDELEEEGQRIIEKAWRTNETTPRTLNMDDAYAYLIYHKGKLMRIGYPYKNGISIRPHKGWIKHNYPDGTGRDYVEWVKANHTPFVNGIELLVVNAIYYSSILEDGKQCIGGRKYKIISQVASDMEKLATKYKGRFYHTNIY